MGKGRQRNSNVREIRPVSSLNTRRVLPEEFRANPGPGEAHIQKEPAPSVMIDDFPLDSHRVEKVLELFEDYQTILIEQIDPETKEKMFSFSPLRKYLLWKEIGEAIGQDISNGDWQIIFDPNPMKQISIRRSISQVSRPHARAENNHVQQ